MGAPMGNKNAAGSHSKGWYKGSGSHRNIQHMRTPEQVFQYHENRINRRLAKKARPKIKKPSSLIKRLFGR